MHRSPSFSRSSSSTRMTILPARISSSARFTRSSTAGSMVSRCPAVCAAACGSKESARSELLEETFIIVGSLGLRRGAPSRAAELEPPRYVASEDVDFNVDAIPRSEVAQVRRCERVRHEHHLGRRLLAGRAAHDVHREAHPVDRDRPLRRDERRQHRRNTRRQRHRVPSPLARRDPPDPVHVPRDDVTSEPPSRRASRAPGARFDPDRQRARAWSARASPRTCPPRTRRPGSWPP